jgi:hypothetical protein
MTTNHSTKSSVNYMLWTPRVNYCIEYSPLLGYIRNHFNILHTVKIYFLKICFVYRVVEVIIYTQLICYYLNYYPLITHQRTGISLVVDVRMPTAKVDIFMVHLTTLSLVHTLWRRKTGRLINNKLKRIWKEVVLT